MECEICKGKMKLVALFVRPQKGEKIFSPLKSFKKKIFRCKNCSHHYIDGYDYKKANKIYKNLYDKKAYGKINSKFNEISNFKNKDSSNYFRKIYLLNNFKFKKNTKLFDYGSGIGIFLFSIKNYCKCYFYEKNIRSKNFCKDKLKLRYVPYNKIKKFKFNYITCNKVLEHFNLRDIKKTLNLFKKSINKKGKIYLELPSSNASKKGYSRQEFFTEHLNIFSKKSINIFFKSLNFKIEKLNFLREINGKYTFRVILSCL